MYKRRKKRDSTSIGNGRVTLILLGFVVQAFNFVSKYKKLKSSVFSKAIFICSFVFLASSMKAQYVSIPDSSFRQALIRLGYVSCFDNTHTLLDTTCNAVLAADSLDVSQDDIYDLTGIVYFKHLQYLNCYHNPFAFLPHLPDSLTTLVCYESLLTSLPSLPPMLRYLNCGDNMISTLPSLPDSLGFLSCETNRLSYIPTLPSTLTYISCYGNTISTLPPLPAQLTYFDCGVNVLDSIPVLPAGLTTLFCGINHLTSLPALPGALTKLFCNNNQLDSLPILPTGLTRLYCFGNQLSTLPALPVSLSWIDCSYNQLSTLPTLPDSLYSFDCRVNMSLYCLPQLKKIVFFSFDSTGVNCLPDYPQDNVSSLPALSSLSVCGISNPHGCLTYAGISDLSRDDLSIYPNPATDVLTVRLNNSSAEGMDYILNDLQGREVLSGSLSKGETTIHINALSAGVYMLHINGTKTSTYKVVKN